jgi:hypothetical protein
LRSAVRPVGYNLQIILRWTAAALPHPELKTENEQFARKIAFSMELSRSSFCGHGACKSPPGLLGQLFPAGIDPASCRSLDGVFCMVERKDGDRFAV